MPGGGAIRNGGTNVGGPGRPPSDLRQRLTGAFAARVPILEDFADGKVTLRVVGKCEKCGHEGEPLTTEEIKAALPQIGDRLKALDLMGKYGPGAVKGVVEDDVRERLKQTLQIIMAELPADVAEPLLGKIEVVWR